MFRTSASLEWLRGELLEADVAGRQALLLSIKDDHERGYAGGIITALMYLSYIESSRNADATTEDWLHEQAWRAQGTVPELESALVSYYPHFAEMNYYRGRIAQSERYLEKARAINHGKIRYAGWAAHYRRIAAVLLLHKGDPSHFERAQQLLEEGILLARDSQLLQEEIPLLTALSEAHRLQGRLPEAFEAANSAVELAERSSFKCHEVDARNQLVEVLISQHEVTVASEQLKHSCRLAECDGSPYAYSRGLRRIEQLVNRFALPFHLETPSCDPARTNSVISYDEIKTRMQEWLLARRN